MKTDLRPFFICLAMLAALLITGCGDTSETSNGDQNHQDKTLSDTDLEDDADSDADTNVNTCSVTTLRVPGDCQTIQAAVNQARPQGMDSAISSHTTIILSNGVYYENVVIPFRTHIAIIRENGAGVTIDGGTQTAITVEELATLRIQEITIASHQVTSYKGGMPSTPAIKANGSQSLTLETVRVLTNTGAVEIHNVASVMISESTMIGNRKNYSSGVYLESDYETFEQPFVLQNHFKHFSRGILDCTSPPPIISISDPGDSNQYEDVENTYDTCPTGQQ